MKTSLHAPESIERAFSWGNVLDFHSQLLEAAEPFINDCITMGINPTVEDYESWKQVQNDLEVQSMERANQFN